MTTKETKKKMISMRMSETQYKQLNDIALQIKTKTGFRITRASIVLKLMEFGYDRFAHEFLTENALDEIKRSS